MKLTILILIALLLGQVRIIAAEAGMPQLDPEYWLSQSFWLVIIFITLYVLIAKFFIPKIKLSIGDRERKIKDDLDEANKLKKISENKIEEYEKLLLENKNKLIKISNDTKKKLDLDIQKKRKAIESQIQNELDKAQIEIDNLKKESLTSIEQVAEDIASKVVEDLTNEKLNQSSIKAIVSSTSKKRIGSLL